MILITGNEGFIGSHLAKKLYDLGIEWVGYDLLSNNNDIRDLQRLDRSFDNYQPSMVIHLAALAGARRGEEYPQEYFDTNVIGTENVARMCEKYGVKKLIAFSSASAKTVQNTYGISKLAMELMLDRNLNIPSIHIVRPFNVYGENGRLDQVIWKWKAKAEAGLPIEYHGDLKRNYTYVGDLLTYLLWLIDNKRDEGFCIHEVGNRKQVGLSELLKLFKEKYPNLKVIEKLIDDTPTKPNGGIDGIDFITKVKELIA